MNLEDGLIGKRPYMSMDFSFDQTRGFSAEFVEEVFEGFLVALGFEHHGAIGLVANPPGHRVVGRDCACTGPEPNPLDSPLKDDPLSCDHRNEYRG